MTRTPKSTAITFVIHMTLPFLALSSCGWIFLQVYDRIIPTSTTHMLWILAMGLRITLCLLALYALWLFFVTRRFLRAAEQAALSPDNKTAAGHLLLASVFPPACALLLHIAVGCLLSGMLLLYSLPVVAAVYAVSVVLSLMDESRRLWRRTLLFFRLAVPLGLLCLQSWIVLEPGTVFVADGLLSMGGVCFLYLLACAMVIMAAFFGRIHGRLSKMRAARPSA